MPGHATLQDLVYFGTFWQILQETTDTPPIQLGGGWTGPAIERSDDGLFFAGMVERRHGQSPATDVILTFAGANGGLDAVQGESILLGLPLDEAARAVALFDAIWNDPAYASATIHVTGHSLGAGYAQYVLAHAIATYGEAAVDARTDFVAFGAPNWGASAAAHFGLDPAVMDSRFQDYTSANDPVLINGVERVGTTHYLPAFDGVGGLTGPALNLLASHWPTTYASALGLPDWLTQAERDAAVAAVDGQFTSGSAIDPNYGTAGAVGLFIDGSNGDDVIAGLNGNDVILGGTGRDEMTGAGGADVFRFDACGETGVIAGDADRILDFSHAEGDRIDLSRIDARAASVLWDDAFTLATGSSFTGAGQLLTWQANGAAWIAGNTDSDGAAEFLIRLDGLHALTAADFIL